MRYEGNIYRPPSEAHSLIVQVTIGCAHNDCTFCGMFKDKRFRIRDIGEILEDLSRAKKYYRRVGRIFLADGDALVLNNEKLLIILHHIQSVFPECERVGVYGSPQDVLRKTPEELRKLRENGVQIIYIGAESGSDRVLKAVHKGATREEIIDAVQAIEASGIKASVTFISGLGGRGNWQEHARETGTMISRMEASFVGLLTLMVEPSAPLYADVQDGRFELLMPEEVVEETILMLQNIDVGKDCVFRSNHASNYVSLKGNLPRDKAKMIRQLESVKEGSGRLKDERFRAL